MCIDPHGQMHKENYEGSWRAMVPSTLVIKKRCKGTKFSVDYQCFTNILNLIYSMLLRIALASILSYFG